MGFNYKKFPSEYELKHISWNGIEYDKERLINFFNRYYDLKSKFNVDGSEEEIHIMDNILSQHNRENLQKLLDNDSDYCRWATIEKLSRRACIEILLDGRYSKETFSIITNLPTVDFKLIMNRTKELIRTINETINESEMDVSNIPGVK